MKTFVHLLLFSLICCFSAFSQQTHPHLFFTKEKVDRLKERIKSEDAMNLAWKDIIKEADNALKENNPTNKIDYLSLAYLVTENKKYAEKVKSTLERTLSRSTWDGGGNLRRDPPWNAGLGTAHTNFMVAIGYDAIYNSLNQNERNTLAKEIVRVGIQPSIDDWLSDNKRIHSLNSMGHNWWTAVVYMAGLSSLAVMNEIPEAAAWVEQIAESAREWFAFNGDVLHFKQKNFDKGGFYESINYANFGLGEYLFFRLAWTNTFPGRKALEIGGLELIPDFFINMSYPRDDMIYSLYFGDSNTSVSGERPSKLLWALGYRNPNMLWYFNQVRPFQHREGLPINSPIGIICQPEEKGIPAVPNLPTSAIYEDMGWASMRTSWENNATMLGVKCGFTWNHAHADASSFILMHKGEQIIKDAGNSNYGWPSYPEYFFQSQAHNVVLFDGKAQPTEQQYHGSPLKGSLHHLMDAGNIKYVLANATGPTSRYFSRNFRHFLWIDNVILIIDDVKTHEYGTFEWLIHPDGEARKVEADLRIINNNACVLVRPLFPETLIDGGYDHDFPEKLKIKAIEAPVARSSTNTETYYSIRYPEKVNRTKFITAIILKDSPNSRNIPDIKRLRGNDMQGVRITQNGKTTDVFLNLMADGRIMHLNSYNTFNGWNTDAYLIAASYPEGKDGSNPENIEELFVGYGSFIRKGEQHIFNSLSKLFSIAKKGGDKLNILVTGQPVINAGFGIGGKTEQVLLSKN